MAKRPDPPFRILMKTSFRLRVALLAFLPAALFANPPAPAEDAKAAKNCGCACCKGKDVCCCREDAASADTKPADAAKRHPVKGVIVDVYAEKSALMVKHEAIPGYMPAMTMLFKVDAATLQAAAKGQAIAATLVERDGEFWLEDVNPAAGR